VTRPLLLVDSASMYFRAFHGIPSSSVTTSAGEPVNALRGFLDMVAYLITTRRPDRVVCCLDADWRPAWRVELLPSYKAHRVAADGGETVPPELVPQVPVLLEALEAAGIATVGAKDYEADDVIATLAAREPGPVEVATGDRDLFQVIDDDRGVTVLYTGRGVAKLEVYDDAALRARYGVPADRYAEFAVLRGDPSDGLPGVPGIGEKTAAALLKTHGDLAGMLAVAEGPVTVRMPQRVKLLAARDYLARAPRVVRTATDVPVPPLDTALPAEPADPDRLAALAERWNTAGPVRRLTEALARSAG
jgi:5'-3' exonuclease